MHTSLNGIELIKTNEGCVLTAYQPLVGDPWTIGWGSTGPDVHEGLIWTQDQADARLMQDIGHCEDEINRCVTVTLTQDEFDALVDFVYNLGPGALESSTMLHLLNEGDYQGAAGQFDLWDHAHGRVVADLLRRRQSEQNLFDS